ncbi:hypothetical protein ADUPG1_011925 [Aduncisulcus paluster]|uniref:Uncharacterized protein n=1 Tax=Aduncisulcus paluster TaxID=2918883 RepID=A0ABQ5K1U3_9EUKA|nr:hypothetical protein ADUPG1_011925 [Aduncisulcus paluster]
MKEDYYSLLGVDKTATDSELKKAYRKKSLVYHPDKASLRGWSEEEATEKFREIKEAYDTLIDPTERAWYDRHKESILKEEEDIVEETMNADLYAFFSSSRYKGMHDEEGGFYYVYNDLFNVLQKEENTSEKFQDLKQSTRPSFGNSKTPIKKVLRFYEVWLNFTSHKSFSQAHQYDPSQARDRRSRRYVEQYNQKQADKARKDYNSLVQRLVGWLQRRDPRWKECEKLEEERKRQEKHAREQKQREEKARIKREKEAYRKDLEEQIRREDAERQRLIDLGLLEVEYEKERRRRGRKKRKDEDKYFARASDDFDKSPSCSSHTSEAISSVSPGELCGDRLALFLGLPAGTCGPDGLFFLSDIEKLYSRGLLVSPTDGVRCEMCSKRFNTIMQFDSHSQSKKHKQKMREEERKKKKGEKEERKKEKENVAKAKEKGRIIEESSIDDDKSSECSVKTTLSPKIEPEKDVWEEDKKKRGRGKKGGKKKRGKGEQAEVVAGIFKELGLEDAHNEDVDWESGGRGKKGRGKGKGKGKKGKGKGNEKVVEKEEEEEVKSDVTESSSISGKKGKKSLVCKICKAEFSSKNKLFQHIKATGHAALKE